MAFDPTVPYYDNNSFQECDWKEFYGDVREAIPSNAPEPCGKSVHIWMYVDSDQLKRRGRGDQDWGSLFSLTVLWCSGYQRNNLQSKPWCLVPSLWQ